MRKDWNIKQICCGSTHSYIIANDQVLGFGEDHRGKMGIGNDENLLLKPMKVLPLIVILLNIYLNFSCKFPI